MCFPIVNLAEGGAPQQMQHILTFVFKLKPGGTQVELDAEDIDGVEDAHAK